MRFGKLCFWFISATVSAWLDNFIGVFWDFLVYATIQTVLQQEAENPITPVGKHLPPQDKESQGEHSGCLLSHLSNRWEVGMGMSLQQFLKERTTCWQKNFVGLDVLVFTGQGYISEVPVVPQVFKSHLGKVLEFHPVHSVDSTHSFPPVMIAVLAIPFTNGPNETNIL